MQVFRVFQRLVIFRDIVTLHYRLKYVIIQERSPFTDKWKDIADWLCLFQFLSDSWQQHAMLFISLILKCRHTQQEDSELDHTHTFWRDAVAQVGYECWIASFYFSEVDLKLLIKVLWRINICCRFLNAITYSAYKVRNLNHSSRHASLVNFCLRSTRTTV